jgi:addiction module HigA family antidote
MPKNGMRPVHPGEVLMEDYIRAFGLNVRSVALSMHVPYQDLLDLTTGARRMSPDMAKRLERNYWGEAKGWLNLQAAYDLAVAEGRSATDCKVDPPGIE